MVSVELAERASARSAVRMRQKLMRRVDSLATVAAMAPLIGLLGTVIGIITSFKGIVGDKSAALFSQMGFLSEALFPTALSLLIAIPSLMLYLYLRDQVEIFDIEMNAARQVLASYLTIQAAKP